MEKLRREGYVHKKGMEGRGRGVKSRVMRGERCVGVNVVSSTQYSIGKDYSTHTYTLFLLTHPSHVP